MATARQKILNYIIEQQSVTVEELSRVFQVTPANIRHHLSILMDQGCIHVAGYKAAPYRGRPTQVYSSGTQGIPNSFESLTDMLLSHLEENPSPIVAEPPLKSIARQMVEKYPVDSSNPTRRLYSSIRVLNQMNYHAHWEAHVENPHIMLDECPFRVLVPRHPEICQLDRYILETLISAPIEQIEKEAPNLKGIPQCVFVINRSE